MPGIAGIIGINTLVQSKKTLDQMVKAMKHEKFYTTGSLLQDKVGAGIGWVCHKGGFDDCLPIWNETKDICLVFSGENFANEVDIKQLRATGHGRPDDKASYLARLYEEYGTQFFEILNGTFSGLLMDLRKNKLILFNDRYGLNRIYYYEHNGAFYFASEAKSLLRALPQLQRLDIQSLSEFFACGCPLQGRTLFEGISLLPPGSAWTFKPGGGTQRESYFTNAMWENKATLAAPDYYQKLRATFTRILPKYFKGSQNVALSLTGGVDSRMIIALANFLPFKLDTYTFGGMLRESADVRVARRVAKICQQYHEVLPIHRKFFNEFPSLASRTVYLSDGAMDVSGAAGLFMNREARSVASVRLTGNYGSEILRGHTPFRPVSIYREMFDSQFLPYLDTALSTYAGERRATNRTSFIAFKQLPWHHYGRLAVEQSQLPIRSPFLDNELVSLAYQAPRDLVANKALLHRLIQDGNPLLARVETDRGFFRRVPLLPQRVRSFCEEFMPRAEYVYDYGMPQWLAKLDYLISPLRLERLFLGRQKYCHFRLWYQRDLGKYVKAILLDSRSLARRYLNKRIVERMVSAHLGGTANYTTELHKLLTAELIQRELIEN